MGVSVSHDFRTSVEMLDSIVCSSTKGIELTIQKECDVTDKTCGDSTLSVDNIDVLHNITEINDTGVSNSDANSSNNLLQKSNVNSVWENDIQCNSVKRKITFADDQGNALPSCVSDDNITCSNNLDSTEKKNCEISTTILEVKTTNVQAEHSSSEIQKVSEENVNKIISDKSSILPSNCESTENSFSDSVCHSPELHISISSVKNVNVSVNVSSDLKTEKSDNTVNLQKKVVADVNTSEAEEQSSNSSLTDIHINSNQGKTTELSDLDSKTSNLPSENFSLVTKPCASATQKRKVGFFLSLILFFNLSVIIKFAYYKGFNLE